MFYIFSFLPGKGGGQKHPVFAHFGAHGAKKFCNKQVTQGACLSGGRGDRVHKLLTAEESSVRTSGETNYGHLQSEKENHLILIGTSSWFWGWKVLQLTGDRVLVWGETGLANFWQQRTSGETNYGHQQFQKEKKLSKTGENGLKEPWSKGYDL